MDFNEVVPELVKKIARLEKRIAALEAAAESKPKK